MNDKEPAGTEGIIRLIIVPALLLGLLIIPPVHIWKPQPPSVALACCGVALLMFALERRSAGVAALLACAFTLLGLVVRADAQ